MRKVTLTLLGVLLVWTVVVWAQAGQTQSWNGSLVDATCKARDAASKCPISGTTTAFGLVTADGTFYKFDSAGNSATSKELEKVDKKTGEVIAKVTGTMQDNTIQVQSVEIQ